MVDVAHVAGVALSTVSRVVNADPTVGPDMIRRVENAIATLQYEPDERARQLRRGLSGTLGAAVRDVGSPFIGAAEKAARDAKMMLMWSSTNDDARLESEVVISLCRQRVDGLIVEPTGDQSSYLGRQIAKGLPVVAIDRPLAGVDADAVVSDNVGGITAAFDHLVASGHRRIFYLGDHERLFTGRQRADAFRECLSSIGGDPATAVYAGEVTAERIRAALDNALRRRPRPTALITGNDGTTIETLRHLGPEVAGLAIVAFDDLEFADIIRPPLTVIAQDHQAMGRAAVELLISRIRDPHLPTRRVTIPVRLIERGAVNRPSRRRQPATRA
jgi:LacI family transcriptional regulator